MAEVANLGSRREEGVPLSDPDIVSDESHQDHK